MCLFVGILQGCHIIKMHLLVRYYLRRTLRVVWGVYCCAGQWLRLLLLNLRELSLPTVIHFSAHDILLKTHLLRNDQHRNKMQAFLNNDARIYSDAEQPDNPYNRAGKATYYSSNKQSNSGFYDSAPAGSKHAKRIQQLCVNMQTERPEQPARMHPHAQLIQRAPQQSLPSSVPKPQKVYRRW